MWHPSFLKSSASAWQSYVAGHPCGPRRERPLLATTQRNTDQPAWVGLQGTAFNAVIWEKLRGKKSPFPQQPAELSGPLGAALAIILYHATQ